MGSFLNQSSHDKSTIMEGEKAVLVILAQECTITDENVIFGDSVPLFKMLVVNEDYGNVCSGDPRLFNFLMHHQEKWIDGEFSKYGFSKKRETLESYEFSYSNIIDGKASIYEYMKGMISDTSELGSVVSKIKNGLVFEGNSKDSFYQIKLSLFKKTTYDKAKKVTLLDENDNEINLKDYREKEIERILNSASENNDKFSAQWFDDINNQIAHPLFYNENEHLSYPHSEEELKKVLSSYFKEYFEFKYLTLLGLEFSPIRYAGQDYGNEIGHMMKNIKKVTL